MATHYTRTFNPDGTYAIQQNPCNGWEISFEPHEFPHEARAETGTSRNSSGWWHVANPNTGATQVRFRAGKFAVKWAREQEAPEHDPVLREAMRSE